MGRRKSPINEDRDRLVLEYYLSEDEVLSVRDVAKKMTDETKYPMSATVVYKTLKRHGVLRNKSDAQKKALEAGKNVPPPIDAISSEEASLKKSKAMKDHWANKTDKEKKDFSKAAKKQWAKKTDEELEEMYKLAAKGRLKAAKEGSRMEKVVVELLEQKGWTCSVHKKDVLANLNLEIDIYVHEPMCVIEIDGPAHFEPIWGQDKLEKQQDADRDKNALVINHGFNIIRAKCPTKRFVKSEAYDLVEQLDEVLKELDKEIREGKENRQEPIRLEVKN